MIRIYVPRDSAARAVGADEVADAIVAEAAAQKISVQIIRNGSRGMMWLEPLVEVETPKGRVAYGPVEADDVKSLFNSKFHEGGKHKLALASPKNCPISKIRNASPSPVAALPIPFHFPITHPSAVLLA